MKLGIRVRKHTLLILSLQNLILFAISKCDNLCTSTFSFVISFIFGVKMEFCIEDSLVRCWFQFFFYTVSPIIIVPSKYGIHRLPLKFFQYKKKKKFTEMENFYKKKKKKEKGKGCGRRKMGGVVEIMLTTPTTILFSIRLFLLFSLQIYQQSSPVPLSVSSLLF